MKNKNWIKIGFQPVGGLREVGFIKDTDYLMVLGSGGRTVFNCNDSTKYARNRDDYYYDSWNSDTGVVKGFDEFEGLDVICGGFEYKDVLLKRSSTGWQTVKRRENRLNYKGELYDPEVLYLKNERTNEEIEVHNTDFSRAYGFSPTFKSFIVGTSHGIYFWKVLNENLEVLKEKAIEFLISKTGNNVLIEDQIATIGLSMEPYQTSSTKITIENLKIENKVEGAMVIIKGIQGQVEFRKNMIKHIKIVESSLQIDILLRDVVWRKLTIKRKNPVDNM